MLLGLDHAIIAVRDLSSATEKFGHALGLTVAPGGEHPDMGTHNAIVRFGTDYLEIISILRPEVAAANERGRVLQQFLSNQEGLFGFALGSDDLDRDVAEARSRGLKLEGPIPGSRRRPDGTTMNWRTAISPGDQWGRRLPFLIQHASTMQERKGWTSPAGHPLKVACVPAATIAVTDLDAAVEDYRRLLGAPPDGMDDLSEEAARRARFHLWNFQLELLQPRVAEGELAGFIRDRGEGLFRLSLAVPNVDAAVRLLRERGTAVSDPTPERTARLLDPSQTLGARFSLEERK